MFVPAFKEGVPGTLRGIFSLGLPVKDAAQVVDDGIVYRGKHQGYDGRDDHTGNHGNAHVQIGRAHV